MMKQLLYWIFAANSSLMGTKGLLLTLQFCGLGPGAVMFAAALLSFLVGIVIFIDTMPYPTKEVR